MPRDRFYRDPTGLFVHDLILEACRKNPDRTAVVDYSSDEPRRFSYAEYGTLIERAAKGLVAAGVKPGDVVAIYLFNCWEFGVTYHAATLAGAIPTPLNPTYREREVRYQLENSGAAMLVTDGVLVRDMNLKDLPKLRHIYSTRSEGAGAAPFSDLLKPTSSSLPAPAESPQRTLAALPYSSGTTGLPKGVMLSHYNLVANVFQILVPGEEGTFRDTDVSLCVLPLYHIYGLNVILNPVLTVGGTLVLLPRFDPERMLHVIDVEQPTFMPLVPPLMNFLCQAAEQGLFPREQRLRWVKCGAAPLAPELPRRFTSLTGVPVRQGYGMTEASPVTHMGFVEPELYQPDSIGHAVAFTDCRLIGDGGHAVGTDAAGELVMRGPQFMLGYWNAPDASAAVLRPVPGEADQSTGNGVTDGWYWSGDVATVDRRGFYRIVDRRKEMIKYKGFPVAPAEVESVLLEHPAVRDCGVVGKQDTDAGEIPCAFVVLRDGYKEGSKAASELCGFVAERLTGYKQPREVRFVGNIPRNPSGKILRRQLRELL
jgi:acyl-CoA synthetase (AMP-forming)/AMP-acid ligase II